MKRCQLWLCEDYIKERFRLIASLNTRVSVLLSGLPAPAAGQSSALFSETASLPVEARNAELPLETALQRVAKLHDVRFLYRTGMLDEKTVPNKKALPSELHGQLDRLLTPHGLAYAEVGNRSYAVFRAQAPRPVMGASPPPSRALTGVVTGQVTDPSGAPLPGVQVVLQGTTRGDVTGPEGRYEITEVPAGTYQLRASFVGYAPQTVEINVADGRTVTQNFTLREDVMQMEGAIVTATRTERTQREATNSVSVLGAEEIQTITPNSQADILRSVPGVHTEGGGGEVASNVFVRGLPAPGQYKYNPIQEDGMPVISETRTTTSAQDIYFRYDLNVERLEFVRGGSAALFGVGSPAGLINCISKTGGSTPQSTLQAQVAQDNLYRFSFNTNGPLTDDLRYNLGGYYRYDEGPVVSDLTTEGLQLKSNLTYLQDAGYLRLHAKYIDDSA